MRLAMLMNGLLMDLSSRMSDWFQKRPHGAAAINYRPRAKKKPNKVSQAKRRKYARQGRK